MIIGLADATISDASCCSWVMVFPFWAFATQKGSPWPTTFKPVAYAPSPLGQHSPSLAPSATPTSGAYGASREGNVVVCVVARPSFAPNPPKRGPLALSGESALGRALRKGGPHD